jgi:hypothetical protein
MILKIVVYIAATLPSLGLVSGVSLGQEVSAPQTTLNNKVDDLYVARVISVNPASRRSFIRCLKRRELPVWRKLKGDRLMADHSVFEITSVIQTESNVPGWNVLPLTHLAPSVTSDSFFESEKRDMEALSVKRCEEENGSEIRRIEVLRATPNSNYSRATTDDDRQARRSKVR